MKKISLVGINYRSNDPQYNFFSTAPVILKACLINHIQRDYIKIKQFYNNEDPVEMSKKILSDSPDIIGFSSYIWNLDVILKLSKLIKSVNQDIQILIGGPHASQDPSIIFKYLSFFRT